MAEREIERWVTVNGVHIPIYKDGGMEPHKDRQINKSEEQATERKESSNQLKDSKNFNDFVRENRHNADLRKVLEDGSMEDIKQEWYQLRHDTEIKNLKEQDIEKSINTVTENIRSSALTGWFRSANSDYKPEIADSILSKDGTLNAGLNIAYYNYRWQYERYSEFYGRWVPHEGVDQSTKLSFSEWLKTPQTMYRGTHGQNTVSSDVFLSYTPDKDMASRFGTDIDTIQISPIETWGNYQTTGEKEFLVSAKWLKENKK